MISQNFQIGLHPAIEKQTPSIGLRLPNDCAGSPAVPPAREGFPHAPGKIVSALFQLSPWHSYQSGGNTL